MTEKQCAQRGICRNPSAYNCTWGFHVPSGPSQTEEDEHEAVVCPAAPRASRRPRRQRHGHEPARVGNRTPNARSRVSRILVAVLLAGILATYLRSLTNKLTSLCRS